MAAGLPHLPAGRIAGLGRKRDLDPQFNAADSVQWALPGRAADDRLATIHAPDAPLASRAISWKRPRRPLTERVNVR